MTESLNRWTLKSFSNLFVVAAKVRQCGDCLILKTVCLDRLAVQMPLYHCFTLDLNSVPAKLNIGSVNI